MKITIKQLRQVIKEEVSRLREFQEFEDRSGGAPGGPRTVNVSDVVVGNVLVSTSGSADMEVVRIEPGGRFESGAIVFHGPGGKQHSIGNQRTRFKETRNNVN